MNFIYIAPGSTEVFSGAPNNGKLRYMYTINKLKVNISA